MEVISSSYKRPGAARSKMIIRNNILNNIKLEKAQLFKDTLMLDKFIDISRHSNLTLLQNLVKDVVPPPSFNNVHLWPLYKDEDKELNVVWLKTEIPPERHTEHLESIFILEGSCDCFVNDICIHLETGGFIQMPIGAEHRIVSTSKEAVKAMLSIVRVKN